jgi:hypothetical protein
MRPLYVNKDDDEEADNHNQSRPAPALLFSITLGMPEEIATLTHQNQISHAFSHKFQQLLGA